MAVPLRKSTDGYNEYDTIRKSGGQAKAGKNADAAPKRLVRRQIRSNAEFRRAFLWASLGIFSVLFIMEMSFIFVKAGVSQMNYDINTMQKDNDSLLLENDRIRGQIAELRSLDRIEEIATRDLGMIKNKNVDFMVLSTTIVAEGKIRAEEEEEPEEIPDDQTLLDKVKDFILTVINK